MRTTDTRDTIVHCQFCDLDRQYHCKVSVYTADQRGGLNPKTLASLYCSHHLSLSFLPLPPCLPAYLPLSPSLSPSLPPSLSSLSSPFLFLPISSPSPLSPLSLSFPSLYPFPPSSLYLALRCKNNEQVCYTRSYLLAHNVNFSITHNCISTSYRQKVCIIAIGAVFSLFAIGAIMYKIYRRRNGQTVQGLQYEPTTN